jgi:DNA polymerase-3 subunit alpha
MSAGFVHLRLHTEFSLVDGLVRIKPLTKKVAQLGMPAAAITDQSNLCALVKFYKAAQANGVKPLCGADIWVEAFIKDSEPTQLTLLVQNQTGYQHLTQLLSKAYQLNQKQGHALVKREWFKEHNSGLIALITYFGLDAIISESFLFRSATGWART